MKRSRHSTGAGQDFNTSHPQPGSDKLTRSGPFRSVKVRLQRESAENAFETTAAAITLGQVNETVPCADERLLVQSAFDAFIVREIWRFWR